MTAASEQTPRLTAPAWRLLIQAVGGPRQIAGKFARMGRTLRLLFDRDEVERRLVSLQRVGLIAARPSPLQIAFGGIDMLRFLITPGARDYYEQRGFSFGFHALLRFLDDPMSLVDPTGLLSDRDTIVGHALQVVHLNPIYDLQLIQMFPDGLEDFERQVEAMVRGDHSRSGTIAAVVEEPDYHERLLEYVRRYRANPDTPQMPRRDQKLRGDSAFAAAERTFATLPGFIDYCLKLPERLPTLLKRFFRLRRFPLELASVAAAGAVLGGSGISAADPAGDRADERAQMVREQIEARGVSDPRVLAAMGRVPRHELVPEAVRRWAYQDRPLSIGHGQTISQPYVVAAMSEALRLGGDEKVLEVGTGSGYQAAVLGELCREVFSIEIVKPLAERARSDLARLGYDNVVVRAGDGYRGWPEQAPFDAVIVTAAPDHVPQPLIDQLAVGGRLVLPVGGGSQELVLITRQADGVRRETLMSVRFVPMTGEAQSGGETP